MALERAGVRKFTELVANHIFVDVHRHMLTAVVNGDRETDEFRKNGRRRDQVFSGRLSRLAWAASTFFIRCPSTNGPFFKERDILRPPYLRLRRDTIIESVRLLLRVR